MADKKISQLTDGTSLQSGDSLVVARSGDNFKVDPTIFDEITATTVDINGGTIDGTTIGATTPSTGDFTTLTENTTPVVIQTDIGTDPNQVPLNQYLGSMAYQDLDAVSITGGTVVVDGLTVDTDTLYVDAANDRVGIGTSSPSTLLHLESIDPRITLTDTTLAGNCNHVIRGADEFLLISADDGNTQGTSSLRFNVDGSEAMRIDSSGRVGIGVSSIDADYKTEIDGRLRIQAAGFSSSGVNADVVVVGDTNSTDSEVYPSIAVINRENTTESLARITLIAGDGGVSGGLFADGVGTASGLGTQALALQTTTNDPLVFRTNSTEAMRIDSSGNLLVGTTDATLYNESNTANAGLAALANGQLQIATDGSEAAYFNRMSSDGKITQFRQDGVEVGSISTLNGDLNIGTGDVGIRFHDSGDHIEPFNITNNAGRDAAIDLGDSGSRFQNLYLSGGVYLGGTGAANLLDDYEEGTFTPVLTGSTSGTLNGTGVYTKVGNKVTIFITFTVTTGTKPTGDYSITGLPFTSKTTSPDATAFIVEAVRVTFDSAKRFVAAVAQNSSDIFIGEATSNAVASAITDANFVNGSNMFFRVNGTYLVA